MKNKYFDMLYNEALKNLDNYNTIFIKKDFFYKIRFECPLANPNSNPYLCGMRIYIDDSIINDFEFRYIEEPLTSKDILKNRIKTIIISDNLTDDVKVERLYAIIKESEVQNG